MQQNPISLYFRDRTVEQEFKRFYELETRVYIRFGVVLAMPAWVSSLFLVHLTIPAQFLFYTAVILSVTIPICIFVLYATYNDRFIGHYQLSKSKKERQESTNEFTKLVKFWVLS